MARRDDREAAEILRGVLEQVDAGYLSAGEHAPEWDRDVAGERVTAAITAAAVALEIR